MIDRKLILRNHDDTFMLKILGHEYPNSNCYYDGNWLLIKVEVKTKDSHWVRESCSLTAFELVKISDWFMAFTSAGENSKIDFIEGDISFVKNEGCLNILLDYGLHPNALNYNFDNDSEQRVSFRADSNNLKKCCDFFVNSVKQFPVRNLDQ